MLGAWQDLILLRALDGFYLTFPAEDCLGNRKNLFTVNVVALTPEPRMVHHGHVKNKISKSTIKSLMALVSDSQQHSIGNALGDLDS